MPGPDEPTRPSRLGPEAPTGRIHTGPDAPTRRTAFTTQRLRVIARSALADTRPLRTPAYRRLWSAGVVTVVGSQLSVVAVPTQIYQLTNSSAYVGLTGVFGLVPLVVFGLWGGAIADVMDRRVLLLASGGAIALSSLAPVGHGGERLRRRVERAGAVRRADRTPRYQPAHAQRGDPPPAACRTATGGQRAQHDGAAGRRHRRTATGRRPDPGRGTADALSHRRDRAARHPLGHLAAPLAPAGEGGEAPRRGPPGHRGVPLRRTAQGAAGVVPHRRGGHGLRHAPGGVPGDLAHRVRRPGGRRPRARAAVRRDPDRHGRRRAVLRLAAPDQPAGRGGDRGHLRVGTGRGAVRADQLAVAGRARAGRGRRRATW